MLHCKPMCDYVVSDDGLRHRFRRLTINFWDDRDFFDSAAVRRFEEYDDLNEAIERLTTVSQEPSLDELSRLRASMLLQRLLEYQETGLIASPEGSSSLEATLRTTLRDALKVTE